VLVEVGEHAGHIPHARRGIHVGKARGTRFKQPQDFPQQSRKTNSARVPTSLPQGRGHDRLVARSRIATEQGLCQEQASLGVRVIAYHLEYLHQQLRERGENLQRNRDGRNSRLDVGRLSRVFFQRYGRGSAERYRRGNKHRD
jgi:hypothetical protein